MDTSMTTSICRSELVTMDTSLTPTNTDLADDNHSITLQLKEEVQVICEKLASYGEESVFISTNRIENTSSFRGSKFGQDFILKRLQIIDQFYNSCMGYTTDPDNYDEQKSKSTGPRTENRETSNKGISDTGTRPCIPSPGLTSPVPNHQSSYHGDLCLTSPVPNYQSSYHGDLCRTSPVPNYQSSCHSDKKSTNLSERCYEVTERGQQSNCDEKGVSSDCDEGVGFEMYISPEVASVDQNGQEQQYDVSDKVDTGIEVVKNAVEVSDGLQHRTQESSLDFDGDSEISNDSVYEDDEKSDDSEMKDLADEESKITGKLEEATAKVQVNTHHLDDDEEDDDDDDDDGGGGEKNNKTFYEPLKNCMMNTRKNVQKEKDSFGLNTSNTSSRKLRSKSIKSDMMSSQTTQTADFEAVNSRHVSKGGRDMQRLKRVNSSKNVITLRKPRLTKASLKGDKKSGTDIVLISGGKPNMVKHLDSSQTDIDAEIKTEQEIIGRRTQKFGYKSSKRRLKTVFTVKHMSDGKAKTGQNENKRSVSSTGMSVKKMFLVRNNKPTDSNRITVKNNTRTAKPPIDIKTEEEIIPKSASIVYPDGHVEQVPVEAKKEPCDVHDESEGKIMTQGEKKSYFLYLNNKSKNKNDSQKDNPYMSCKDNAHLCNVCGKIYKHKKNLKDHMFKHSGDYPYSCPLCDRKFPKKGPMQTHLNNHLEYKMFMCEFCGKRFASSGLLGEHRKVHREGKPYACRVCDKRFPRKTYLTKHMKFHKENKEYMCEECGKRFFTSTHLKRHYLIHTGVKQYRCTLCPYECNQSGNLKIHMKVHRRDLE